MFNPVCVKCGKELDVEKNGVVVVKYKDNISDPTKVIEARYGDLYKCKNCGYEVVLNFSKKGFKNPYITEWLDIKRNRYVIEIKE